ncbi:hypothetical protein G7B40_039760 [Aetokthonos hydrillicola Thurmond2011]|jgi:hypothetical protein|uniref:Uncharacterized protein n=1 Tax=Aetokthonos hydrillicola Thurmond2011 TaxID=2712845 RepID=A0AAP5IHZ1_9CYAN|nr:hypothetical protein [Aetokthonos hydrillicola]MBW4590141.1 hypothetical protein [Aetokthonos hydrillicola CCALA 1050]MDR9900628.1 hypothetical protein [Aetokthonos hydrillicola Thurmond2011]
MSVLEKSYQLSCSSAKSSVVIDLLFPLLGNAKWTCQSPKIWGDDGGSVFNEGNSNITLIGKAEGIIAIIEGFSKAIQVGDIGRGEKYDSTPQFPNGIFAWSCIKIS